MGEYAADSQLETVRSGRAGVFRSLRVPNFRRFFAGQVVSVFGNWMQFVAQDWLVLELSGNSGAALGTVISLQLGMVLLFGLVGGKLADRYDKRRLIAVVNVTAAVMALTLGLLVITGTVRLWQVFVFAALFGTLFALEMPTRQAYVSELVDGPLLPNAISLNSTTVNLARVLGPAAGGVLIAWLGIGPVYLLNAVSYAGPLLAVALIDRAALVPAPAPGGARAGSIRDGLRYAGGRPDLLLPLTLALVAGTLFINLQLTLPVLAKVEFARGAASFGLLTTAFGVGALGAALVSGRRVARPGVYVVLGAAFALGVAASAVPFARTYLVAAVLLAPVGFLQVLFNQAANQRLQLGSDPAMRGRVLSLLLLALVGIPPLTAPVAGLVVERYGPRVGLLTCALACVAAAVAVFAVRTRQRGVRVRLRVRPRPHLSLVEPACLEVRIPAWSGTLPAPRRPEPDTTPAVARQAS